MAKGCLADKSLTSNKTETYLSAICKKNLSWAFRICNKAKQIQDSL